MGRFRDEQDFAREGRPVLGRHPRRVMAGVTSPTAAEAGLPNDETSADVIPGAGTPSDGAASRIRSLVPVNVAERPLPPGWQTVFVLSSFFVLYMSAIGFGAAKGADPANLSSGNGDWLQQVVYVLLVLLVCVATLVTSPARKLLAIPIPLVITLAWCWLSVTWAIEPSISLRRVVLTSIIVWTVFRSVDAIDFEKPVNSARSVLVLTLIVNFFFALFVASGVHHGADESGSSLEGAWRGITAHKNFAGAVCAFTILMFSFDTGKMKPWSKYLVIAGSLVFLYKTQSKTSELILAGALIIGLLYRVYNPAYRWIVLLALGVMAAVLAMYVRVWWYAIINPFFMPDDFTNRGMIWNVLFGYAKHHWMLGSGYGSFWNIGFTSPAFLLVNRWQLWIPGIGSGHSGYFDLLATVGVPGLILGVSAMILIPLYRLLTSRTISPTRRALTASMLAFCAGHNFTETSLLDRDSLVNVFMLLTVALIYKATRSSLLIRAPWSPRRLPFLPIVKRPEGAAMPLRPLSSGPVARSIAP